MKLGTSGGTNGRVTGSSRCLLVRNRAVGNVQPHPLEEQLEAFIISKRIEAGIDFQEYQREGPTLERRFEMLQRLLLLVERKQQLGDSAAEWFSCRPLGSTYLIAKIAIAAICFSQ